MGQEPKSWDKITAVGMIWLTHPIGIFGLWGRGRGAVVGSNTGVGAHTEQHLGGGVGLTPIIAIFAPDDQQPLAMSLRTTACDSAATALADYSWTALIRTPAESMPAMKFWLLRPKGI